MSYFGSQTALRVPVDTSSGTTWAKAEEAVGRTNYWNKPSRS